MPTLAHHNSANKIDLRATGAIFLAMLEGCKVFARENVI
jgi:hypothetical protein